MYRSSSLAVLLVVACSTGEPAPKPEGGELDPAPRGHESTGAVELPDEGSAGAVAPSEPVEDGPSEPATPSEGSGLLDDRPERTHVSFETAMEVEVDGFALLQDVVTANQVDYYRFTAEAGAFYEVKTDRHRFSPDLVVSLHDAEHRLIAQNDEGRLWPGDGIDARLVVRVPEAGEYFVRVEDPWTPTGFFDGPFPLLYYHLSVRQLPGDVAGIALAQGSDPVQTGLQLDDATGISYVTLLGEFADQPSVFELAASGERALVGLVLPSGAEGNGSTAFGGGVRVVDAQAHLLAQIDRTLGQAVVAPPVGDEAIRVEVLSGGDLGDNPFYALDVVLVPDNPTEQDDAANGELAGAEVIALEPGTWRQGLVRLTLSAGDVDHWTFEAEEGESVDVRCEGESGGSGVRELTAEVLDAAGNVIAEGAETALANLEITRVPVAESGPHYLRLSSATTDDVDAAEPWVRCSLTVGP